MNNQSDITFITNEKKHLKVVYFGTIKDRQYRKFVRNKKK